MRQYEIHFSIKGTKHWHIICARDEAHAIEKLRGRHCGRPITIKEFPPLGITIDILAQMYANP